MEKETVLRQSDEHPWSIPSQKDQPERSKKATANEGMGTVSGQTIRPEINPSIKDEGKTITPQLKDKVSEFVTQRTRNELSKDGPESLQESVHNIRYREMSLPKNDIDKTYETKNYAYLRSTDIKDTRIPFITRKKNKEQN